MDLLNITVYQKMLLMDQIKGQQHSTSTKLGWAELLLRLRLGLLPPFVWGTDYIYNFNLDLGFKERARETILSLAEFIINVFMFSAWFSIPTFWNKFTSLEMSLPYTPHYNPLLIGNWSLYHKPRTFVKNFLD